MTIWTPSGERPIRRQDPVPPAGATGPAGASARSTHPQPVPGEELSGEEMTEEEMLAHMREVQRQLAETPAAAVVVNHCMGLFQLAVLHLNHQPPNLTDAQLAIDAMAAIVESLGSRLGDDEKTLKEALTQLRMAFVQVKAASP